ncbi:MAG: NAD-glutamate dehydrogenase [Actinobacteria bacterium]|nr:NAD-glutamate dehydrogenase [Actinomycetota bacterium]MCB9412984.1 NAD-glutamate dehydrogenase [Actinomycetota bacterium]
MTEIVQAPLSSDPVVNDILQRGVDQAEQGHPPEDRVRLARLVRDYFAHVDPADLIERDPTDLVGMVTSHRRLAAQRLPGEEKLAVFTPSVNVNGWSSGHTVMQVVIDDMPFLVDSVSLSLTQNGHDLHLVIHPQFLVRRDSDGQLEEVYGLLSAFPGGSAPEGAMAEAWISLEINRESDAEELAAIEERAREALTDVSLAVRDWPQMRAIALGLATELRDDPPVTVQLEEVAESAEFIDWLADDHFTFLGYREYDLSDDGEELIPVAGSSLGIMREASEKSTSFSKLPSVIRERAREPHVLVLTKANSRSMVHRATYLDYVGVKRFDANGEVVGERRFLGLYTGSAYAQPVHLIPVLRQLQQEVTARAGVDASSHRGKDLLHFIETYPRDDLFQVDADELYRVGIAVLGMQERRMVRVFVRRDTYSRFDSVMVYLPRDQYTTTVRLSIQAILMETLHGTSVDYTTTVSDSVLARLNFTIRVAAEFRDQPIDVPALEARIRAAIRSWDDEFGEALVQELGEESAATLTSKYVAGLPDSYREDYTARAAVADIRQWEALASGEVAVSLYEPLDAPASQRRFKLFRVGQPVTLLEVLPILAALDVDVVDEHPYVVSRTDDTDAYLYDFGLTLRGHGTLPDFASLADRFSEAFLAAFNNQVDPDATLGLVTRAGLTWRQASYVQAWVRYSHQIGSRFSFRSVATALLTHPRFVQLLVKWFEERFDPDLGDSGVAVDADRRERSDLVAVQLAAELDAVLNLDTDRILRGLIEIVGAILRTNVFQRVGARASDAQVGKPWLSFKINPRAIENMPEPRPQYEIWVNSPRTAGVHLRFGSVARGGLRWSDRRDDFRTEVLGLVKAQEVKNAVIVPVGSKGGFVVRQPVEDASREEIAAQGRACYTEFISGLLDLTDNRVAGEIVPPERTVRWDDDDSYLVVAADKGTATFSDLANSISASYGFWLGDAFASGGSDGYDHKAMGITARGAWESVKRHFRELGMDVQTEPFTVVGIGDMSGDVFGNGMLLSTQIRLVAAFDHRHIFLDPDPDPAVSFAERKRLFELPRSSWADYDRSLISPGGGVFARTEKWIEIGPQLRDALGIAAEVERMSPPDVLRAILQAPVDLLWNGGIGTYVKGSSETDQQVGDKANDAIRINGDQVRARVVGEGGNLGLTQLGRIEAALSGVALNTDAVDNSAGVDCSDHEVNIKIALDRVVNEGDLTTKQRNALLVQMTDDVADLVLADNYEQNVLLGNARVQSALMLPVHARMMRRMELEGLLDRALEYLPSEDDISTLRDEDRGMTSPEFCTLMAYSKNYLTRQLNESDLASDPFYSDLLLGYFPEPMVDRYPAAIEDHPLRREIISTMVANSMINRGGITFAYRANEETGASAPELARAYSVSRAVFDLPSYWARIEALDNIAPTTAQAALHLEVRRLLDRSTRWFLTTRGGRLDVRGEIERFAEPVQRVAPLVAGMLVGDEALRLERRSAEFADLGAPPELAHDVAVLLDVFSLLDTVQVAAKYDEDPVAVTQLYFALSERFAVDRLLNQITGLRRDDRWDALARSSLRSDLYGALAGLTARVLRQTPQGGEPAERIAEWEAANAEGQARARATLTEIVESGSQSLATISVALRVIRTLVYQGTGE